MENITYKCRTSCLLCNRCHVDCDMWQVHLMVTNESTMTINKDNSHESHLCSIYFLLDRKPVSGGRRFPNRTTNKSITSKSRVSYCVYKFYSQVYKIEKTPIVPQYDWANYICRLCWDFINKLIYSSFSGDHLYHKLLASEFLHPTAHQTRWASNSRSKPFTGSKVTIHKLRFSL